jgi:hypothetical protein
MRISRSGLQSGHGRIVKDAQRCQIELRLEHRPIELDGVRRLVDGEDGIALDAEHPAQGGEDPADAKPRHAEVLRKGGAGELAAALIGTAVPVLPFDRPATQHWRAPRRPVALARLPRG